jgi:general secretion pathway protein A
MHPPITPLTLPAALSPAPVPVSDSRAPADAAAALSLNLPTTVASLESPSLQIDDAPAVRSEPAAQPDIWGQERDPDLAQVQAYRQLFRSWQLEYDPREQPVVCEFAASRGLGCLSLSGDVELLAQLDRPAVTRLLHRGRVHEVLVRQLDEQGALLSLGGEEVRLSRDAMAAGWLGEFTLLWRVPPDYREPLWPGAQGTAVAWLDSQLARAAGQTLQRPPRQIYDAQLVTQLRAFQQRHGLSVDGVAGPRTLIRLNSVTGVDQPRLVMR